MVTGRDPYDIDRRVGHPEFTPGNEPTNPPRPNRSLTKPSNENAARRRRNERTTDPGRPPGESSIDDDVWTVKFYCTAHSTNVPYFLSATASNPAERITAPEIGYSLFVSTFFTLFFYLSERPFFSPRRKNVLSFSPETNERYSASRKLLRKRNIRPARFVWTATAVLVYHHHHHHHRHSTRVCNGCRPDYGAKLIKYRSKNVSSGISNSVPW